MKHLGVCLQRLPREERFYRHQTSSQLQPTPRPRWRGAPKRPSSRAGSQAAAHLPHGPEPAFLTEASGMWACLGLLTTSAFHSGVQVTGVIEFQGKVLIGVAESR